MRPRRGSLIAVARRGSVGSSVAAASSWPSAAADAGLKRGSRASACITAASTGSGTDGSRSRTGVIAPLVCSAASSGSESNSYGGRPVRTS